MKSLKAIVKPETIQKAENKVFPGFVKPMLATLTDDYFDDPNWIYERKLGGQRCVISIENGEVSLYSRNEKKLNVTYPEFEEALQKENYPDLILDAEIVTFDDKVTSFSKLQNRMQIKDPEQVKNSEVKVFLYVFDIMYYDTYALNDVSLKERKKILKEIINWKDPIRYVPHRNEKGNDYHSEACKKGWEGIIAKDGKSTYSHSRSKKWLKFKCGKGQELVIGGFTDPQGERVGFGAMLVGYYKDDSLRYAGKVGTGYDDDFLEKWRNKFDKIEIESSPFEDFEDDHKGTYHWVKPKYVGEFGFREWTDDDKLRHPRFLGMRDDKDPKDVVKEEPK
ncbi:non-homologous end-joining DNA ligase [Psychroflexus sp. CAK8W]|uniref:DNA ligase (ATP) n=1 Tax=Psychroflexus longus TaxID=2873596 RepID=A0ABS7XLN8_9FLAO|nr:non-homologous end-joining DNA ligase [Psychroflexus longus]MBZ9778981.1 non-homologous end-joining DNA ligase [Psychroflexus longus]